jgi:hypothetical protein
MLRVWFGCSPFVPSEHGIKVTAPLEVYTKDKQHAIVRLFYYFIFCCLKEWKGQTFIDNWLPSMGKNLCHSEVCMSGSKCLKAAEPVLLMHWHYRSRTKCKGFVKDAHPHTQTNKTWSVLKQWFLETVGWLLRKLLQDCALILLVLGANLCCDNHLYSTLTRHKWTTNEPHS